MEKEESADEGFECVTCNDEFAIDAEKHCGICNSSVCEKCLSEGNIICYTEWLDNCPNTCARCKRIGCGDCIKTCYQCWNISESHESICDDCNSGQLTEQDCEYHNWWLCENHSEESCVQCHANKNYGDKYAF
jgi:hypothetical protein